MIIREIDACTAIGETMQMLVTEIKYLLEKKEGWKTKGDIIKVGDSFHQLMIKEEELVYVDCEVIYAQSKERLNSIIKGHLQRDIGWEVDQLIVLPNESFYQVLKRKVTKKEAERLREKGQ